MWGTETWTLAVSVMVFVASAGVIALAGSRATAVADRLADRTGLGEAVAGAVLLGATTSLSGSVLSVTAALEGRAELAIGNAVGGIAVQTAFLAVADITYRRANLEHAAASTANMAQAALLVCLLSILLLGAFSPEVTVWGVHPLTPFLIATYAYGLRHVRKSQIAPMWRALRTRETRIDQIEEVPPGETLVRLWWAFASFGLVLALGGWFLERAASVVVEQSWIGETVIGLLVTSTSTSLPELITSVAAVRRGALTLAVGGIIGGNVYDTLFAAFSDVAYREGSVYHAISDDLVFWIALSILMTGVLLLGLIRREEKGIGGIGFESFTVLLLYASALVMLL